MTDLSVAAACGRLQCAYNPPMALHHLARRLVRTSLSVFLLAAALAAQAPLLGVASSPAPGKPNLQRWTLTNNYSAAATEWVFGLSVALKEGQSCKRPDPQLYGNCIRATIHTSALPALKPEDLIAPHADRMLPLPAGPQLRILAVIYADGASAGDAAMVAEMLAARQVMLHALQDAVPMLQSAGADANADYRRLLETFQERSQQYRNAVKDAARQSGPDIPALGQRDKLWASLARDLSGALKYNLTPQQLSTRLAADASRLQSWLARMQSLPATN
jgi:hypothetical protein